MVLKTGLLLVSQLASLAAAPAPQEPVKAPAPTTLETAAPAPPEPAQAPVQGTPETAVPAPQEPAPAPSTPEAAAQAPAPIAPEATPEEDGDKRLFSMMIKFKEVDDVLLTLSKQAGIQIEFLSPAVEMITTSFNKVPLRKAMAMICEAGGLEYKYHNGIYVVGISMDMHLRFPSSSDTTLDAAYMCRNLDATALATALGGVLPPEVKITPGPRFLSPALEGGDPSGAGGEAKAITSLGDNFKVHDIVISGPADLVRRALLLARKFDRPRKQVKINIRITEVSDNDSQNFGINWMQSLSLTATESPTTAGGTTVDGIRLGKFSHTPLAVNATLNALEHRGKAKTLANPTLLIMDGERSFILSGQKYMYPKYTGKDTAGLSLYDVAEAKIGIYLQVAVHLGENNDVLMSLIPQVTNISDFKVYNGGTYPIINTREAQTTVHAYSGEMIVLGGLIQDSTTLSTDGVPFLSKIPLLGKLFSSKTNTKAKSELMIFLTPEVIDDLDHIEKMDIEITNPI